MAERDPRTEPKAGDVLRVGCVTRTVLDAEGIYQKYGFIYVIETVQPRSVVPVLKQWRKWAKKAEVIHAAD